MAAEPVLERFDDTPQPNEVTKVDMSAVSATERAQLRWFPDPESPETVFLFQSIRLIDQLARPSVQMDAVKVVATDDPTLPETIRQASRQVYSRVYRMRGIVADHELDQTGVVPGDPKVEARTTRFLGINGRRVAAAGMVQADKKDGGLLSLPTFAHLATDPERLFAATGAQRLIDLDPSEFVEITGLGVESIPGRHKTPGEHNPVDVTYFEMLARSLVGMDKSGRMDGSGQSKKWWVMNVEDWLRDDVAQMAGEANIHDLGDLQPYMGPDTRPILLDVLNTVRAILDPNHPSHKDDAKHEQYATYLRAALRGADEANIPDDIRTLLRDQGVELRSETRRQRVAHLIQERLKDPNVQKAMFIVPLVGYSVGRDVLAGTRGVYDGNMAVLMAVDVATAFGQAWSMQEGWSARSMRRRIVAAVGAVACFAAPYAFVYAVERQNHPEQDFSIPPAAKVVIGGMAGVAVYMQASAILRENRLRRGLRQSDIHQGKAQELSQAPVSGLLPASPVQ